MATSNAPQPQSKGYSAAVTRVVLDKAKRGQQAQNFMEQIFRNAEIGRQQRYLLDSEAAFPNAKKYPFKLEFGPVEAEMTRLQAIDSLRPGPFAWQLPIKQRLNEMRSRLPLPYDYPKPIEPPRLGPRVTPRRTA